MKFVYADSLDYVDPDFDFEKERSGKGRVVHMHDEYPHEYLKRAPYDGLLVSRAIVGDARWPGKYSEQQRHRFRREGARNFLRYQEHRFPGSIVMGDCGAFSYASEPAPPYKAEDTVEFYADGGFTHGCSIDHVIFDFDDGKGRSRRDVPADIRARFDMTLELATSFIRVSKRLGKGFTPLGVVQGWSASSMAEAAAKLTRMGYRYLAVGGLVPLKIAQIQAAVSAIREAIGTRMQLHLLGFGKIEELPSLRGLGVTSFDTTSPMLRSFKDAQKNYFARDRFGDLSYYTAIRVPQATLNAKLKRMAMEGVLDQEKIRSLETTALEALRSCGTSKKSVERALDAVTSYWEALSWEATPGQRRRALANQRISYKRTLESRCWEHCSCAACRESGIDVVIFRSSNRNKRRGMHNLQTFYQHLLAHREQANETGNDIRSAVASTESQSASVHLRRDSTGSGSHRTHRTSPSPALRRS